MPVDHNERQIEANLRRDLLWCRKTQRIVDCTILSQLRCAYETAAYVLISITHRPYFLDVSELLELTAYLAVVNGHSAN